MAAPSSPSGAAGVKLLWWDGRGLRLFANDRATSSSDLARNRPRIEGACEPETPIHRGRVTRIHFKHAIATPMFSGAATDPRQIRNEERQSGTGYAAFVRA
jgi:hypothetical protein